jgi:hypothetical protein
MLQIKRIVVTCLAICLLVANSTYAELLSDTAYIPTEQAVNLLTTLNIIKASISDIQEDPTFTRSEFAVTLIKMMGLDRNGVLEKTNTSFEDVKSDNEASGYIDMCTKSGYMNGYGDGKFGPYDTLTIEQAVKSIVSVLGYEVYAKNKGGYPMGYLSIAAEKGILKGVNLANGATVTKNIMITIVYNALNVDLMKQVGYGTDSNYEILKGKTLLTEFLKVLKSEGQIIGTHDTRLSEAEGIVQENEVEIDGTAFKLGTTKAKGLLGYQVTYYYHEDEVTQEKTLVSVEPIKGKNKIIEIQANDIENYSNGELTYWWNKEIDTKVTSAKFSKVVSVIFNGKAMRNFTDEIFKPQSGKLLLLDVDSDEIADIVFVNTFVNYVVKSVSKSDNKIIDKYNQPDLILESLDKEITFSIIKDGQSIGVQDLKEWDILSVEADKMEKIQSLDGHVFYEVDTENSTFYNVFVIDKRVKGKINAFEDTKVLINDREYQISDSYIKANIFTASQAPILELNVEGIFFLDADGKIAAVDISTNAGEKYGYLFDAVMKTDLKQELKMKILCGEGDYILYKVAENVKLNGDSYKPTELLNSNLLFNAGSAIKQLISYFLNSDGEIKELNTAVNYCDQVIYNNYIGFDENTFSKDYTNSNVIYRSNNMFALRYLVNANTKVFLIPKTNSANDEDYHMVNTSNFVYDNYYSIDVYDVNKEGEIGVVVVKADSAIPPSINSSSIALIDRVSSHIDEKSKDATTKLYFIQNGKLDQTIEAKDDTIVDKEELNWGYGPLNIKELKRGDIIQYSIDQNGKLDSFRVLYSPYKPNAKLEKINDSVNYLKGKNPTAGDANLYSTLYAAVGKVIQVESDTLLFNAYSFDENKYNRLIVLSGVKVYQYDSIKNKISIISMNDIEKGQKIFVRYNGNSPKEIVILK